VAILLGFGFGRLCLYQVIIRVFFYLVLKLPGISTITLISLSVVVTSLRVSLYAASTGAVMVPTVLILPKLSSQLLSGIIITAF
jgi:hypothetical protein